MAGTGGATTLLTATMTTAWRAATRLTVAHPEWSGAEVVSEEVVTAATGGEPSIPSTQRSQWALVAMKIKVGFGLTTSKHTFILLSCNLFF